MNDSRAEKPGRRSEDGRTWTDANFGIEPRSAARIRALCDTTAGLAGLFIFGSRARGDHRARSDIDLEADAPGWTSRGHLAFIDALKHLPTVYPMDCVWRQGELGDALRQRIARDRKLFWSPTWLLCGPANAPARNLVSSPPDRPSPPAG